jgi:hypothetical protein
MVKQIRRVEARVAQYITLGKDMGGCSGKSSAKMYAKNRSARAQRRLNKLLSQKDD